MILNARQKGAARLEEDLTLRSKLMDGFVTPLDLAKQRSSDGAMLQLLEKSAQNAAVFGSWPDVTASVQGFEGKAKVQGLKGTERD